MKIFGPRLRTLSLLSNVINSSLIAFTEKQNLTPTSVLGINLSSKTADHFNSFVHYNSQQSNQLKNTNIFYDLIIANFAVTTGFLNFTQLIKFVSSSLSADGVFIFLILSRHSKQVLYKFLKNYNLLDENILLHGLEITDQNFNLYNEYLFHLTPTIPINARILMLTKSQLSDLDLLLDGYEEDAESFEIVKSKDINESNDDNTDEFHTSEDEWEDEIELIEDEKNTEIKSELEDDEYNNEDKFKDEHVIEYPENDNQTEDSYQNEFENDEEENELDVETDDHPEFQEIVEEDDQQLENETETEVEENVEEEMDTDSESESDAETDQDTEIESQNDNDNESDSEGEADQDPDSEPEADNISDSDSESESDAETEQSAEIESQNDNDKESDSEGEADQDPDSEPEGDDEISKPRLGSV